MVMIDFLGLNPKCYSFRFQKKDLSFDEFKKSEVVSFATVAKTLPFKAYKKRLDEGNTTSRVTTHIGSFNQQLFSFDTHKIALNSFYDKLYTIDQTHCQPCGFAPTEDYEFYQSFINT